MWHYPLNAEKNVLKILIRKVRHVYKYRNMGVK